MNVLTSARQAFGKRTSAKCLPNQQAWQQLTIIRFCTCIMPRLLVYLSNTPVVGTLLHHSSNQSYNHTVPHLQSLLQLLVLQSERRGLLLELLNRATAGATLLTASSVTPSTYSFTNLKFEQLFASANFCQLSTHFGVFFFQRTKHFTVQRLRDGVFLTLKCVLVVPLQSETQRFFLFYHN